MLARFGLKNYNKTILENFLSLFSLQVVSYFFPLITFPYLTYHLGIVSLGKYVIIVTVINYFNAVVSYGFDVTATDFIAKNAANTIEVTRTFWSVLKAKLFIFLLILLPTIIIISLNSRDNLSYVFYGILWIAGCAMSPIWLFQGLQKMKYVTIVNVISKTVFTLLLILFVNDSRDIHWAVASNALGFFFSGILSFILAIKTFRIKLFKIGYYDIFIQLKDGYQVFLSKVSVNFYSSINLLILGALSNPYTVGVYSVADKVFKICGSFAAPFNRAIFPFLSEKFSRERQKYNSEIKKFVWPQLLVFAIIGFTVYYSSSHIVEIITNDTDDISKSISLLKTLSYGIPFLPLGALFTYLLVIQNKKDKLLKSVIFLSICNLIMSPILIHIFGVDGLAYTSVFITVLIPIIKGRYVFFAANHR